MATTVFANYDRLPEDRIRQLARERGLNPNGPIQGVIAALERLDRDIDTTDIPEDITYYDLQRIAIGLGIDAGRADEGEEILEMIDLYYDPDYAAEGGLFDERTRDYALERRARLAPPQRKIGKEEVSPEVPRRGTRVIVRRPTPVIATVERFVIYKGARRELPTRQEVVDMKIAGLRNFLRPFGIPTAGRSKAELMGDAVRLVTYLEPRIGGTITEEDIGDFMGNVNPPAARVRIPGQVEFIPETRLRKYTVAELKEWLDRHGINRTGVTRKAGLLDLVRATQATAREGIAQTPTLPARTLPGLLPHHLVQLPPTFMGMTRGFPHIQQPPQIGNQPTRKNAFNAVAYSPNLTPDMLVTHINAAYYYTGHPYIFTPIDHLMIHPDLIDPVSRELLPSEEDFTPEDKINYLWWHYAFYTGAPHMTTFDQVRRQVPELRDRRDIDIYFYLHRGVVPPSVPEVENPYTLDENLRIARFLVTNYIGGGQPFSLFSPLQQASQVLDNPLIEFPVQWQDNPDEMSFEVGMLFPPHLIDAGTIDKTTYFVNNLWNYVFVHTRPEELEAPPILEEIPVEAMTTVLSRYTDEELLGAYEITFETWPSRTAFIQGIISEVTGGAKWSLRTRKCQNIPGEIVTTLEERTTEDPKDPALSYGTLNLYRCYQVSELAEAFREDKDLGFVFSVPDWIPEKYRLPGTPYPDFREFPLPSMRQLRTLLERQTVAAYTPLLDKVNTGIRHKTDISRRIKQLAQDYQGFDPEDQRVIRDYLFFIFLLGSYMRFWKGPGYEYPIEWVEGGGGPNRCDLAVRDKSVEDMFTARTILLEGIDTALEGWIMALPRIRYDFRTGAVSAGQETINYIIEEAQAGNFCLAEASDHMLRTGYYLAIKILGISNEDFNRHLKEILERPDQPDFDPTGVTGTNHIDPYHNLRDEDANDNGGFTIGPLGRYGPFMGEMVRLL